VRVDSELRVKGYANLFAAGDCACFESQPLPKSGVYAVREGPYLGENIRRVALGERNLRAYRPQKHTLALLTSGHRRALMSYHSLNFEGRWLWNLKSRIDRRFMLKFGARKARPMREAGNTCGGCGGKVSAGDLEAMLGRLRAKPEYAKLLPAAVEDVGLNGDMVTSIDGFRSFTPDLFFFGQVAAWHALNDLYASGVRPSGVSVFAGMPEARPRLRRNQMEHLMSGVLSVLSKAGAPLLNAHTAVSDETTLVLSVNGRRGEAFWPKGGLRPGDALIVTKPIGTGVLLQAQMAGGLPPEAWRELRRMLLQSHEGVSALLQGLRVTACTDITGFGLAGHLLEMAEAADVRIQIRDGAVALLPGFRELDELGFRSHLAEENKVAFAGRLTGSSGDSALWDPQTHGPLAIGVPGASAIEAVARLRAGGFSKAYILGQAIEGQAGLELVKDSWARKMTAEAEAPAP
jgi:selenide,water dikinase